MFSQTWYLLWYLRFILISRTKILNLSITSREKIKDNREIVESFVENLRKLLKDKFFM